MAVLFHDQQVVPDSRPGVTKLFHNIRILKILLNGKRREKVLSYGKFFFREITLPSTNRRSYKVLINEENTNFLKRGVLSFIIENISIKQSLNT